MAENRQIKFINGLMENKSNLPCLKSSYQAETFSICMMFIGSHKLMDFTEQSWWNGQIDKRFKEYVPTWETTKVFWCVYPYFGSCFCFCFTNKAHVALIGSNLDWIPNDNVGLLVFYRHTSLKKKKIHSYILWILSFDCKGLCDSKAVIGRTIAL